MSRSSKWFVVGLALLLGVGAGLWSWRRAQRFEVPQVAVSGESESGGKARLSEVVAQPVPVSEPLEKITALDCREFWRNLVGSDLRDLVKEVQLVGWRRPSHCRDFEPGPLAAFADEVMRACQPKVNVADNQDQACVAAMYSYRARLVLWLTRSQRNFLDMPVSVLVNRLYGAVMEASGADRLASDELLAMVSAIKSRQPADGAYKLATAALYIYGLDEKDEDLAALLAARWRELIDTAPSSLANDPEMLAMELHDQVVRGEEGLAEIERFVADYPNEPVGQYYLAAAKCAQQDQSGCVAALERAVALAPSESDYQKTLDRVKSATFPTSEKFFNLRITLAVFRW